MELLKSLGRALVNFTLNYGVVGLGLGAFLESLGIPTAAIVIDLTAGALILSGKTTFLVAWLVSDLGLVLGSLASYYIGRTGSDLVERFHRHRPDETKRRNRARELIDRYGDKAILFGQLFGPARTWISYPAGAMRMDVKKFTLNTAIGGAVYCAIVILISLYLTGFIRDYLPVLLDWVALRLYSGIALGAAVLFGLWLWLRRRRRRTRG